MKVSDEIRIRKVWNGYIVESPRDLANDTCGKINVFQHIGMAATGNEIETLLEFLERYFQDGQ